MRYLSSSSSMLSLLLAQVLLPHNVAQVQTSSPPTQAQPGTSLPPINVEAPRRRPATRQTRSPSQAAPSQTVAAPPVRAPQATAVTPLNTNVVAPSASRLGLTPR